MQYMIKLFKKKHKVDMSKDKRAIQKLRREVERVKRTLSSQHSARLEVESLYDGIDFSETLTRARFEDLNIDLFKKTMAPVSRVLSDAGLSKSEVDEVVLSVDPLVFPRFSLFSRISSTVRSPTNRSTPMRLWRTVLPFRVVFSRSHRESCQGYSSPRCCSSFSRN